MQPPLIHDALQYALRKPYNPGSRLTLLTLSLRRNTKTGWYAAFVRHLSRRPASVGIRTSRISAVNSETSELYVLW